MWNLTHKILVTILIVATFFSSYASSHSHSRMRFRTGGSGVRGRRDGEVGSGGYGSSAALESSVPAQPALYSAPKLTTFESVRVELAPTPAAPAPPAPEEAESLEQQTTTTTEESSAAAADQEPMEDSTMEAVTQVAEATDSTSISSAENEVSVDGLDALMREGTTENGATFAAAMATESPSGRYLSPKNQGRQRDSFAENSVAIGTEGGYYKPSSNNNNNNNGGGGYQTHYDSSAAFSSYYSAAAAAQAQRSSSSGGGTRPIDQQQVENFNFQQFTAQNALPSSSQQQQQDALSVAGGYDGPRRQHQQQQQRQQQAPEPSYEQIAAVEKSFYSTMPVANAGGYSNNNNNGYSGTQNQGNGYTQQQQQQQGYTSRPQFRYIAQQPELFYPTPAAAVGPVQQYVPINPLATNARQQEPQPQQQEHRQQQIPQMVTTSSAIGYSYPDPPSPPAHIQNNINEVVQQNIGTEPQPHQQQQQQQGYEDSVSQYAPQTAVLPNYQNQAVPAAAAGVSSRQDSFNINTNAINVVDDDSMELTFEGLNDNVVDAELLERVQRIIDQHERQQKEFLARQRESGEQGGYSYAAQDGEDQPQHEIIGPGGLILESPKPAIQYEVDTRNGPPPAPQQSSYNRNEISPRADDGGGGYGNGNGNQPRFSQQLQQHQAFNGNGNGNGRGGGQGRALQGKKINNLDVQPAILTQHFMESGAPSNLQRQTFIQRQSPLSSQQQTQQQPPLEQAQERSYLPPRQEYANSEPRAQAAGHVPAPVPAPAPTQQQLGGYALANQYQQQQSQPVQNSYQQPQSQQVQRQNQYVSQPLQRTSYSSGGYPEQQSQPQVVSNGASYPGGYSSAPSQFQQPHASQPAIATYEQQPTRNDDTSRGFSQQFRQEYSRPRLPQPQVEIQSHGAPPPPQAAAYPSYQYSGNTNSIDTESESESAADAVSDGGGGRSGGYETPKPNVITKTIVIHEQPAPSYEGQYPAGISNRAIITADDLRGTGLGGIRISMQRPQQPQVESGHYSNDGENEQQQQQQPQPQFTAMTIPQYQQYLSAMSQFAAGSEGATGYQQQQQQQEPQVPSMIYLPIYQQPEPQSLTQEPIQMPKPVYGIPLAPALGPESISSLPPSTYGNPAFRQQPQPQQPQPQQQYQQQQYSQYSVGNNENRLTYLPPQYSNAVDVADAGSDQVPSAMVQDSAAQQSIWDSSLQAIYRLPNNAQLERGEPPAEQTPEEPPTSPPSSSSSSSSSSPPDGPSNTVPLVSQIVSLPTTDSQSSSSSSTQQAENSNVNGNASSGAGGYGARISSANRRSIRRSFLHMSPVNGHRFVSVRTSSRSST